MPVIYPPRPKGKISPDVLDTYEKSGIWVAQRKFNGQRNLIHISRAGEIKLYSRHGGAHARFKPTQKLVYQIERLNLKSGTEYWLDSELLDAKTTSQAYKGKIILFDVLQAGRYLFGNPTQMERLEILRAICRNPVEHEPTHGIALRVSDDLWMAETFEAGFKQEFDRFLQLDEIEGLVLRKRQSVLDNPGLREYEVTWQVRCRKPHKNYQF